MNVLITGGLGFIGATLANRLCSEHRVTVLTRSEKGRWRLREPGRVEVVLTDLECITPAHCEGMDLVIHCASTVDNYNIQTDPYLDVRINCTGTLALLEACKTHRPKLLFLSTYFVYGNQGQLPADEDSPCHPLGLYPATKLCAEQFCQIYGRLYEFHVNVCRLTNVYGPGEAFDNIKKGAFNYLIRQAQLGEPLHVYGGGDFFRDYLYIDDAVKALVAVAERGLPGELYLAGHGQSVIFRDLIDTLHRLTNRKSAIDAIEPPQFHQVIGIRNFSADISKISALGWAPQVGLEEGIKRTLAAYES